VRVHVFGNACQDVTYWVPALPRPGETIVANRITSDLGGKGLNQAIAARRTGAPTRFFAAVGQDEFGAKIKQLLIAENISIDGLSFKPHATDTSHVLVGPNGENTIVTVASCATEFQYEDCQKALTKLVSGDIVLLQGNLDALLSSAIMRSAHERGCHVMLNPSPLWKNPHELLRLADILVMNCQEAEAVTGDQNAQVALGRLTVPVAVVTAGADGAFLKDGTNSIVHVIATPVMVRNTTGAGDVLVGSLAGGLALGLPIHAALNAAVALATDKVTREGVTKSFPPAEMAQSTINKYRNVTSPG
jgi:ribokinase